MDSSPDISEYGLPVGVRSSQQRPPFVLRRLRSRSQSLQEVGGNSASLFKAKKINRLIVNYSECWLTG